MLGWRVYIGGKEWDLGKGKEGGGGGGVVRDILLFLYFEIKVEVGGNGRVEGGWCGCLGLSRLGWKPSSTIYEHWTRSCGYSATSKVWAKLKTTPYHYFPYYIQFANYL